MRDMQPQATPEEQLERGLYLLLVRAGHDERLTGFALARPRRDSLAFDRPGFVLTDTTLHGAPAWYIDWHGPAGERPARLAAYQATLDAAGWTAIPVIRWPSGVRLRWRLHWPPQRETTVGLLVQAPAGE